MRTLEIIGYKRANLGKSESKNLRAEGNVPCVLYGGKEQVHFHSPMILFRELVYTNQASFVTLNIEGEIKTAILQDIQFHPVSEVILHADFLELFDDKEVKMDIPLTFSGSSPGVAKGGNLIQKLRYLQVKALPKDMPESINVDVSDLDFGRTIKVGDIAEEGFQVTNSKLASVASVEIPRALRSQQSQEEEDGEEAAEE
ncbi:MAG: 50S ribosomal protein L25/general stress protein Ctc [Bacteroidota bacterium]